MIRLQCIQKQEDKPDKSDMILFPAYGSCGSIQNIRLGGKHQYSLTHASNRLTSLFFLKIFIIFLFLILCMCKFVYVWGHVCVSFFQRKPESCCRNHLLLPIYLTNLGRCCQSNPELTITSNLTMHLALEIVSLLSEVECTGEHPGELAFMWLLGIWVLMLA